MTTSNSQLLLQEGSFYASIYNREPFRMIGVVDVLIAYPYGTERVTLGYYSSSGTNSGKIKGLWYPIVGVKLHTGPFTEFTPTINSIVTQTTYGGAAKKGWLVKSLFFYHTTPHIGQLNGYSNGRYHDALLHLGETLRTSYENHQYNYSPWLTPYTLNTVLQSNRIYPGNTHSQKENYEQFLTTIFHQS